jgi:integrase
LNEARELRLGDLDFGERTLRVRGETSKSRRDRLVDVPADVALVLHRYVRDHRKGERSDDAPLFTTRSGVGFTVDGFGKVFTKFKERSGIVDFSAHLLRHTWATNFRRAGSGDIFDLQEQGGWKRLDMVRRYAKQRPREERLRAPSPLAVLGGTPLRSARKVGFQVNRVISLPSAKTELPSASSIAR